MTVNLARVRESSDAYADAMAHNAATHDTTVIDEAIAAMVGAAFLLASSGLTTNQIRALIIASCDDATEPVNQSHVH